MAPAGPCGPFRARQGPILGHFGDHFGAQVPTTLTNVSYGAQREAFTASFCAMLAVFQAFIGRLGLWGSFGALLEVFCGIWSPFWTFWRQFGSILSPFWTCWHIVVAKFHLPGDVAPVWGLLDPIWASAGGKVPPF